jgi:hypothetical protein
MKYINQFDGQNWLITPVALAVGERPPASIHDQKWLLVLTGVVRADLKGTSPNQWLHETLFFLPPGMAGFDDSGPLNFAISRFSIPKPAPDLGSFRIAFSLVEWAPLVTLSSIFNQGESINSGFAVDEWHMNPFEQGIDILTNQPVTQLFSGIKVNVAVRDSDAWILRISYNITLLGKIVFQKYTSPPIDNIGG